MTMENNESGVSWEFDAPKYFDFQHPEQSSSQWDDSWFGSQSPEASRSNRLRLRGRRPPLPGPSRPIGIKSTTTIKTMPSTSTIHRPSPPPPPPASARRDIFAALASTKPRSSTLQKQQPIAPPSRPAPISTSSTFQGRSTRPTITPMMIGSMSRARMAAGQRDVAAVVKRITHRFGKKQPEETEATKTSEWAMDELNEHEDEQQLIQENEETSENPVDNNKENVPPHERLLLRQEQEKQQLSPSVSPMIQEQSQLSPDDRVHHMSSNPDNENEDSEQDLFTQERNQDILQHQEHGEEEVALLDEEEMEKNDTIFSGRSLGDEIAMANKNQPPRSDTNTSSAGTGKLLYSNNDDNDSVTVDSSIQAKRLSISDNKRSLFDEMMERMDKLRQTINTQSGITTSDEQNFPSLREDTVTNDESRASEDIVYMEERRSLFETKKELQEEEAQEEENETSLRQQQQQFDDQEEDQPVIQKKSKEVLLPNVNKTRFDRRPQRPIASQRVPKDQPLPTTTISDNHSEEEKGKDVDEQDTTRMRRWLDDLPSQPDATTASNRSSSFLVPEKSRSVPSPRTSSSTKPYRTTTTLKPTNFDVLFERMAKIRSELLQVAKTSAIKPAESDLIRNIKKLEGPITGKMDDGDENLPPSDSAIIEQRIARARKVIEESKRDSQLWFVNKENQHGHSLLLPSPASLKRKSTVSQHHQRSNGDDDYHTIHSSSSSTLSSSMPRPTKIHRPLNTYSQDIIHHATTRRESMQHDISVAERVEKLKQRAARRASRVSIVPSYLPIEPTVPKSPTFATDARSRLSTNSRTYHY
ncbi:hypothetical protein BDA99DRAFT_498018 [Phascolomyces articulosus]|uniref:Uncharacterized protein n=1 Tax=Phascolomyces articulosus TaxID=60185 RepID=A0AAD5PIK9_9FUNG|nr:hypothetical protein BDA99DRAFT_498018 [Phascolomyces articulosus]